MQVFVTGATGFIGGEVVRRLREHGDEVTALVRSPGKAEALRDLGCTLVEGGLTDASAIRQGLANADAAVHGAAVYKVGIPAGDRPAMRAANVGGTRRLLEAAREAGTAKVVYISTVAAFGNTHGRVVDETYSHPHDSYTSYYEQTKVEAHDLAQALAREGLPVVTVQPGVVYGPDDHSEVGDLVKRAARGRLPLVPFAGLGVTPVHRDDVAAGVMLALDAGRSGEAYVLAGEPTTQGEMLAEAARAAGRKPPRGGLPTAVLQASAPLGPVLGPPLGFPPNFRELVTSGHKVTFWASADKARGELGFSARPLAQGLTETVRASAGG